MGTLSTQSQNFINLIKSSNPTPATIAAAIKFLFPHVRKELMEYYGASDAAQLAALMAIR